MPTYKTDLYDLSFNKSKTVVVYVETSSFL